LPHHPIRSSPERTPTRAAIISAVGDGGISLIELSGPDAAPILDRLFRSPRGRRLLHARAGKLYYGFLFRGGRQLDEVIVECAQVEPYHKFVINCHGGQVAAHQILGALVAEGAREAEPAERLALAEAEGDINAVQREAALHLPRARTLRAAGMLLDQFRGALAAHIAELRDALRRKPERSEEIVPRLDALLRTFPYGAGLVEPASLVIAGRPNVGKSTLANALLRCDRVIVHASPGTTRDVVEDYLSIRGVPFRLADTAGVRVARGKVEREGVERARRALACADIAILLFDGSESPREEDETVLTLARPPKFVAVVNKSDLPLRFPVEMIHRRLDTAPVMVSALTRAGMSQLEERILRVAYPDMPPPGAPVLFTERQAHLIREAADLCRAGRGVEADESLAAVVGP